MTNTPAEIFPVVDRTAEIERILEERVMVMDGAWGVMLQRMPLSEDDYRGEVFAEQQGDIKGCIDALCLTRPDIVLDVQRQYLDAGADILTTNTFTATQFGLSEFGIESYAYAINRAACETGKKNSRRIHGASARKAAVCRGQHRSDQ